MLPSKKPLNATEIKSRREAWQTSKRRQQADAGSMISDKNTQALSAIAATLQQTAVAQVAQGPSHQTLMRLELSKMLTQPDFRPRYCHFDYIHMIKPIKKNSASKTSLFLGDISGPPAPPAGHSNDIGVAVKLALKSKKPELDNSLAIERINYQVIANTIILNQWSPNVLAYVASFGCSRDEANAHLPQNVIANIEQDIFVKQNETIDQANQAKQAIAKNNELINKLQDEDVIKILEERNDKLKDKRLRLLKTLSKTDSNQYDFLITEGAVNAVDLWDWFRGSERSILEIKSVIFQILYTFECFNRIGFRHNDAHTGNIFIENWGPSGNLSMFSTYKTDWDTYLIPTKKCFVKIFDFDRSYFSCDPPHINPQYRDLVSEYQKAIVDAGISPDGNCKNTLIDTGYCDKYGSCNSINPKYDAYLTLTTIIQALAAAFQKTKSETYRTRIEGVAEWIDSMTKGVRLNRRTAIDANGEFDNAHIQGDYTPTDDEMPTVETILKDDFFKEFRSNVTPISSAKQTYELPLRPD